MPEEFLACIKCSFLDEDMRQDIGGFAIDGVEIVALLLTNMHDFFIEMNSFFDAWLYLRV